MLKRWEKISSRMPVIAYTRGFYRFGAVGWPSEGAGGACDPSQPGPGQASAAAGAGWGAALRRRGKFSPSPVLVERQRVDHDGVSEEVDVLPGVPQAVGPAQVEGVLEAPVDGLGVAPPE